MCRDLVAIKKKTDCNGLNQNHLQLNNPLALCMDDAKYTKCQDVAAWKDSLKVVPLKIAPPDDFSPQIYLLDMYSRGNKAKGSRADSMEGGTNLILVQCKMAGIPGQGSPHPGHPHYLSPCPGERQLASLSGADLESCPQADTMQHLKGRQGGGGGNRLGLLAWGTTRTQMTGGI